MKEFEEVSLNDLLHEEISEHIMLEMMNNSLLTPEILQKIVPPLHITIGKKGFAIQTQK